MNQEVCREQRPRHVNPALGGTQALLLGGKTKSKVQQSLIKESGKRHALTFHSCYHTVSYNSYWKDT